MVTLILALLGQGGFTVIGLNTLVLGVGASIGPLVTGALMKQVGPNMFYAFASVCALVLVLRDRLMERWRNTRYAYEEAVAFMRELGIEEICIFEGRQRTLEPLG